VTGSNNWLQTGADPGGLTATVTGADPGFTNAAQNDFTLATGSAAVGAAAVTAGASPDREYYRDETVTRQYRVRATAKDLGAFESTTTAAPVGPYGTSMQPGTGGAAGGTMGGGGGVSGSGGVPGSAGVPAGAGGAGKGATGGAGGVSAGPAQAGDGGCGCRVAPNDGGAAAWAFVALSLWWHGRRARRRRQNL